ncbi:MAG: 1-(5-phosphoribosyl)-5-amino-4-imidazole-carboxylate carboxylase, partial [Cyanobacteria bacterium J06635_13]
MTQPEALEKLLKAIASGEISPTAALEKLKHLPFESLDQFAKIDHHRQLRTGFPEVIWGADKTVEQLIKIITAMRSDNAVVMATRIKSEVYQELQAAIPDLIYYPAARICSLSKPQAPNRNFAVS